jgi:hypothetical protein
MSYDEFIGGLSHVQGGSRRKGPHPDYFVPQSSQAGNQPVQGEIT